MNGLLKKLAAALALAVTVCGGAHAEDLGIVQSYTTYIAEDTTREMLTTLHSRLDAFRKVQLPVAATPAPETVTNVVAPAAYGSLVAQVPAADCAVPAPEFACGDRYLNRIWGGGIGTWQKAGERDAALDGGYKFNGQGAILGIDRAAGAATFGAAVSYVRGKFEDGMADDSDSDIEQYSAHVYATYNNSRGFFFTLMGGYTFSDNELLELPDTTTPQTVRSLETDYRTHTFSAGARMGFDFEPGDSVVITPSIGANFFHSRSRDHDVEFGVVRNNGQTRYDTKRYENMKQNQVEIPFDITIAKEFYFGGSRMLHLSVNGGYAYNLNNKGLVTDVSDDGGNSFSRTTGRRLGHHAWTAGAGLRLKMDQWDIGAKYDYLGRNDYNSHRVLGTVGYSF